MNNEEFKELIRVLREGIKTVSLRSLSLNKKKVSK